MEYALATAAEMPELITDALEIPSPMNPSGIKGVGELPTVAAPAAVANAEMEALSNTGVRHVDTPLMREKVRRALQEEFKS